LTLRLTFHGAAGEVTGSMHLLEVGPYRVLLDCGLFQGNRAEARRKNAEFPAGALEADAVVLSHAHIDHAGRLPLLVRMGYRGPIYCTAATRDLAAVMLPDSGHIQEADAEFLRRRGREVEPLYTAADAQAVAGLMVAVAYDAPHDVLPGIRLTFTEAGHILGSASIHLELDGPGRARHVVFSGDVGRRGLPIIRDPAPPALADPADVLIVESTYAGRVHETVEESGTRLAGHVAAVAARGGKIFVPAFAVGRTQEILYELHRLVRDGRIPEVPVYVDSPLAVEATDVFRRHAATFDRDERLVRNVRDIFDLPNVHYVRSVDESKALNGRRGPAVIIAASGMAETGRIVHHLRNGLGDHRNLVLIVGWQASHTLGNKLREGRREVRVFGEPVEVRAGVAALAGYSAHGDREDLAEWVGGLGPPPRRAFCVHGEAGLEPMANLLRDVGAAEVAIPELHQEAEL
jgi:metallo-beta-lactamase family protein